MIRTGTRLIDPPPRLPRARRWLVLGLALLAAACGGSGSSGFGVRLDQAAIDMALDTRGCSAGADDLVICAADGVGVMIPGSPQPTPVPEATGTVETNLPSDGSFPCQSPQGAPCQFTLRVAPNGFPPSAEYRVALREVTATGSLQWRILPAPRNTGSDAAPSLEQDVPAIVPELDAAGRIQLAVLVYLTGAANVPEHVTTLAESGADFAFVSAELGR